MLPRCLSFHPEGNVLFSGSHDSLKIHRWEPSVGTYDHISMGWGKIRDMAIAATQMVCKVVKRLNLKLVSHCGNNKLKRSILCLDKINEYYLCLVDWCSL